MTRPKFILAHKPDPNRRTSSDSVWPLRNAAYQYAKRTGKKFTVRAMPNEIRVWRVE